MARPGIEPRTSDGPAVEKECKSETGSVSSPQSFFLVNNSLCVSSRPRGYKTFSMLNSTEHEIFLLINVKMPTIVGILTFMSRKNSIIGLSELEKVSEFLDIFILMSI